MTHARTILMIAAISIAAGSALADWNPGDGSKMHFPQLPDETGWDVNMTRIVDYPPLTPLADDFRCTWTGPITGIHLWASVRNGDVDLPFRMDHVEIRIREDIPASQSSTGYSMPGRELWVYTPRSWSQRVDINSETWEGWWDPIEGTVIEQDHHRYHQLNFDIPEAEAFPQEEGTIYWLEVACASYLNQTVLTGPLGWKTSQDHWNDVAVYWEPTNAQWLRLFDPVNGERLDLAFVITPEPATMTLLALGGLAMLRRRR